MLFAEKLAILKNEKTQNNREGEVHEHTNGKVTTAKERQERLYPGRVNRSDCYHLNFGSGNGTTVDELYWASQRGKAFE